MAEFKKPTIAENKMSAPIFGTSWYVDISTPGTTLFAKNTTKKLINKLRKYVITTSSLHHRALLRALLPFLQALV